MLTNLILRADALDVAVSDALSEDTDCECNVRVDRDPDSATAWVEIWQYCFDHGHLIAAEASA